METRTFKNTDVKPSLLGLGCMRLPLIENTDKIDYQKAQEIVDYAYSHGVKYFDTAYPYHFGESEKFVGEALKKYPRDSYYLATKMPGWEVKTIEDAERIFDEQLSKCQTDYFDFYLCHALSAEAVKIYEKLDMISFLDKKKQEGKIKHLGFSFHDSPEVLEKIIEMYDWDFCQLQINYLDWSINSANKLYEIAEKHNTQVVIMEPVRGGLLAKLDENAAKILTDCEPYNSVASWAIRYAASLPNVLTVLSGMSNMEQVTDNVKTMTDFKPLSDEERSVLKKAVTEFKKNNLIPCTGCRYCMDCPHGVDIPALLKLSNEFSLSKYAPNFVSAYEALGESKQAHNCVECGECKTHCPQHLDIPTYIKQVGELYKANK